MIRLQPGTKVTNIPRTYSKGRNPSAAHLEPHDQALALHVSKAEVDVAGVAVARHVLGPIQHHALQLAHDAVTQPLLQPARSSEKQPQEVNAYAWSFAVTVRACKQCARRTPRPAFVHREKLVKKSCEIKCSPSGRVVICRGHSAESLALCVSDPCSGTTPCQQRKQTSFMFHPARPAAATYLQMCAWSAAISCAATSQAAPRPTTAAVGTVPLRRPRSWPPPDICASRRTRGLAYAQQQKKQQRMIKPVINGSC